MLGNSVQGNKLYGTYPQLIINSNNNATSDWSFARGQYIPTTAVEQVAATLAKWMGVSDGAAIAAMSPNLANFPLSDLGFLSA